MTSIFIQPCDIQQAAINTNFAISNTSAESSLSSKKEQTVNHEYYLKEIAALQQKVQ